MNAAQIIDCPKCAGRGTVPEFSHVDNGTCFRCDGTGKAEAKPFRQGVNGSDWRLLCTGEVEGVAMVVWMGESAVKIEMTVGGASRHASDDPLCTVYADREAWRRRDLRVTRKSFGYSVEDFGAALVALRRRLAAA
jgi:hypothetical protein